MTLPLVPACACVPYQPQCAGCRALTAGEGAYYASIGRWDLVEGVSA